MTWRLTTSCAPGVLDVVDGRGRFVEHGPHYSRRRCGGRKITGPGQEIVLITECGRAAWAVVLQRAPTRDRAAATAPLLFRNVVFRNLGGGLSSRLIRDALAKTHEEWIKEYGAWPQIPLRTEIDTRKVTSKNPGFCYMKAGWARVEGPPSAAVRRPYMRYFVAPPID